MYLNTMRKNLLLLLYILAFIKLLLPFFLQDSYYQPHRDEYLYLAEGRHLAWGYMEVPPLLSIFAALTHVLGDGVFWIKLWPALFGALTFLMVGKMVLSLGGRSFALVLSWLPFVIDVYMRLFFLFQPNFLEVFFWTAIGYCVIGWIQSGRTAWLYGLGVSIGLGMMSKYSVAFYTVSVLAGLAISRHRGIYRNKHFYFALALAGLIFLPNAFWQYAHNFPVVKHMTELQDEQLKYIKPGEFIISQLLMNLPCVYVWIAGLLFMVWNPDGKPYRALGWAYVGVITLLVALHGKDYYALGAYPVLFAFGGCYLERLTAGTTEAGSRKASRNGKWTRSLLMTISLAIGLWVLPLVIPVARPASLAHYYHAAKLDGGKGFKWEDLQYHPLPQDYGDMIGWREMALKAGAVYHRLPPAIRDSLIIFTPDYCTAGALNYYRKEAGIPEVYSTNASFLFWMPDRFPYRHWLRVDKDMPEPDEPVFKQFAKVTVEDSLVIPYFRESGMRYTLFENGNDSLQPMAERIVAGEKKRFVR